MVGSLKEIRVKRDKMWLFLTKDESRNKNNGMLDHLFKNYAELPAENKLEFIDIFEKEISAYIYDNINGCIDFSNLENLKQLLQKQGFSYALIAPVINEVFTDNRYLEFMQGRVSWSDYFEVQNEKIDLSKAFNRAALDRVLKIAQSKKMNLGKFLRNWRGNIIRQLSEEKRIEEASQYTPYLDHAATILLDPEKSNELKGEWQRRIDDLLDGLKALKNQNNL